MVRFGLFWKKIYFCDHIVVVVVAVAQTKRLLIGNDSFSQFTIY